MLEETLEHATERDKLLIACARAAGAADVVSKFIGFIVRTLPDSWTPKPGPERVRAAEAFEENWRRQRQYFDD